MTALPGWTKRWGPTIYLAIAVGGPLLWVLGWAAPRVLFVVDGERRVGIMETQIAGVARSQRSACQVHQWLLWWVSVNSEKQGWVEIPPHVLRILQDQTCGPDPAAEIVVPLPAPYGGVIAGELDRPPPKEATP